MRFYEKYKIYIIPIVLIAFIGIICLVIHLNREKLVAYVKEDEEISFLKNYKVNEFVPVYITDEQMVRIYYNDYINKMLYDRENAYSLLTKGLKKERFSIYNEYDTYINKLVNDKQNFTIKSFNIDSDKYETIYTIVDNNNDTYIFHIVGVMQYTVEFYSN